jgi:hypothetical protein
VDAAFADLSAEEIYARLLNGQKCRSRRPRIHHPDSGANHNPAAGGDREPEWLHDHVRALSVR